ncbi:unnamed protein product [Linum trigynum]|uniref:Uncharacterized protein n=1 Tax=Linum trigynum TaxID=586398 RepID=A0AAV2E6I9_9ROSI
MAAASSGRRAQPGVALDMGHQPSKLHLGMTSHLGRLCISAPPDGLPTNSLVNSQQQDERMAEQHEPNAKRARLGPKGNEASSNEKLEVETTGPYWSQSDP